jgi:hypothetical protein
MSFLSIWGGGNDIYRIAFLLRRMVPCGQLQFTKFYINKKVVHLPILIVQTC